MMERVIGNTMRKTMAKNSDDAETSGQDAKFKEREGACPYQSESVVRRPGKAPEGTVPGPSPGRHAAAPINVSLIKRT